MNRRSFLKKSALAGMSLALSGSLLQNCVKKQRPNILFIMSDDHACKAISAYDGSLNQTPNIDSLASEGMRFERSYCTNAICAPSRAVILTGKHSHNNGHIDNSKSFDGSQQTFPKLLQKNGYQTAVVGKWHLISEPTGFDYWNILPGQGSYYNPDFIEMGEKKQVEGYVTDLITDSALNWLDQRDKSKSFCLMLHHKAPHRNWMPAARHLNLYDDKDIPVPENLFDDFRTRSEVIKKQEINIEGDLYQDYDFKVPRRADDRPQGEAENWTLSWNMDYGRMNDDQKKFWDAAYKDKNEAYLDANLNPKERELWKYQRYLKDYLRCIAAVDENIGRVMKYLKDNGLDKNTVVVYTSDQGFFLGEHGLFDKRFMYEESFRMPLIIRYPGEIQPAVNSNDLVQNLDFAPTFLDYAGLKIPEDMQGESLRAVLKGKTPTDWREAVYFHFYEFPSIGMVRRHYGVRDKRYKLIHFYHDIDAWELFDLETDPMEMNNVFNDPAYKNVRADMEKKLQHLREKYGDTDNQRYMPKPPLKIEHVAVGCPVTLKYKPSHKYHGDGPNALTDGLRAPDSINNYNEHAVWQGFEKENMDAIIDFKSVKEISKVEAGFLQQVGDWIFMPKAIRLETSINGKSFKPLARIANNLPEKTAGPVRQTLTWQGDKTATRYLRIVAENIRTCPDWHHGAGGRAWIFADEVVVY